MHRVREKRERCDYAHHGRNAGVALADRVDCGLQYCQRTEIEQVRRATRSHAGRSVDEASLEHLQRRSRELASSCHDESLLEILDDDAGLSLSSVKTLSVLSSINTIFILWKRPASQKAYLNCENIGDLNFSKAGPNIAYVVSVG